MAGRSAQQIADRRHSKFVARNQGTIARHRILGPLVVALRQEPQSTRAWFKGAEGERKVGARLDRLIHHGAVVLHDRQIPGSRANIDHLAVGPSGIYVIDAKFYRGRVEKRDKGGFFSTDWRIYVGSRDCTKLIAGLERQVQAVRAAVSNVATDFAVEVHPILTFIEADWPLLSAGFRIDGVEVRPPRGTERMVTRPGPLSPEQVQRLGTRLGEQLRPA